MCTPATATRATHGRTPAHDDLADLAVHLKSAASTPLLLKVSSRSPPRPTRRRRLTAPRLAPLPQPACALANLFAPNDGSRGSETHRPKREHERARRALTFRCKMISESTLRKRVE